MQDKGVGENKDFVEDCTAALCDKSELGSAERWLVHPCTHTALSPISLRTGFQRRDGLPLLWMTSLSVCSHLNKLRFSDPDRPSVTS